MGQVLSGLAYRYIAMRDSERVWAFFAYIVRMGDFFLFLSYFIFLFFFLPGGGTLVPVELGIGSIWRCKNGTSKDAFEECTRFKARGLWGIPTKVTNKVLRFTTFSSFLNRMQLI